MPPDEQIAAGLRRCRPAAELLLVASLLLVACSAESNDRSAADPTVGPAPSGASGSRSRSAFGLDDEVDGYRLEVSEREGVGGQAIDLVLTKDREPVGADAGEGSHVFVIGEGLSFFQHEWVVRWDRWMNVERTGPARVIAIVPDPAGDVVLGADVVVTETSDFEGAVPNPTHTEVVQSGTVLVRRDGWTFSVAGVGSAPDVDRPTWLTVVRDDGALSLASLDRGGDGTYAFEPDLPGAGDYLAVLEVAGGQSYSFFVTVDKSGALVPGGLHGDLVEAIESFIAALDDGDHVAVLATMSARCRDMLPPSLDGELAPGVDPEADHVLMQVDVQRNGGAADVDYRVVIGSFEPGITPDWSLKRETWVLEEGAWRRDTCERGHFEW